MNGAVEAVSGKIVVASEEIQTADSYSYGLNIANWADVSSNGNALARTSDVLITATGSIIAQGGIFATNSALAKGLNADTTAVSGNITIEANKIDADGDFFSGIYAVTDASAMVKGTGTASAAAGDITINVRDSISATGLYGIGIAAQSLAYGSGITANGDISTNGDISINVFSGTVTGGSSAGSGISLLGGATNSIVNHGTISALSGQAIAADEGNETVENFGTIVGNVLLGSGNNAINNNTTGTLISGSLIELGSGNTLTNRGEIKPGGDGVIQTTFIAGNFVQEKTGRYLLDADWSAQTSDFLTVSGEATLAGTVVVNAINFPTTQELTQQFHILRASGGATDGGIAAADTATVDYSVVFDSNGIDVYLHALINFLGVGTGGLNANQTAIGETINAVQAAGGSAGFSPVANALMTLPTQQALAHTLDQLSPEIYNYEKIETLFAAEQFSSDLMSCRVADGGGVSFIREGQCLWARARARFVDLESNSDNIRADATVGSFSSGAQVALAEHWRLGFAAGHETTSLRTATGASAEGDRANVGGVLKYNPGPLLLAAVVSGGWTTYDTTRSMAFGGFAGSATGHADVDYVSGRFHAGYLLDQGGWYLKPQVDGTVTRLDFHGVGETGGGGTALAVASDNSNVYAISPALEIGSELRLGEIAVLRPFLRAGVTWRDGDKLHLAAGFADAPDGVGPFAISTATDEVLADVSAGFDLINRDGAVMRLQYDGRFGDETAQNSASVKGSVPF